MQQSLPSLSELPARDALRVIIEAYRAGEISARDAIQLATPAMIDGFMYAAIDHGNLPASTLQQRYAKGAPGAATGKIATTIGQAADYIVRNQPYILVLDEPRPEHILFIEKSAGVITYSGGSTSHATIIARQKGKPALVGTGDLKFKGGETVTMDGGNGSWTYGEVSVLPPDLSNPYLKELLEIAEGLHSNTARKMTVKTNADTPADAAYARELGAQGIGVVRTEHMFFGEERLPWMQDMIMAETTEARQKALSRLFDMQKQDFKGILQAMTGLPVTVRLLDAPLHEFMPHKSNSISHLAKRLGTTTDQIQSRIETLEEVNPMLGNRGIRLGLLYPEIFDMQIRALLEASSELLAAGVPTQPQIMVPLVSDPGEVKRVKEQVERIAHTLEAEGRQLPPYQFGIMTEIPASCVLAADMAKEVDFFSFGTNDLTQTTLGFSRDDTANVIADYMNQGIFMHDPFETLHPAVTALMEQCVTSGKAHNSALTTSMCGEHGGDPESIRKAQRAGVDVISVSPPRIPLARLCAVQAMLEQETYLAEQTAVSRLLSDLGADKTLPFTAANTVPQLSRAA